jgi:hypothetical protein
LWLPLLLLRPWTLSILHSVNPVSEPAYDQSMSLGLMESNNWVEWDTSSTGWWEASFPLLWADHSLGFDPEHDWGSGFL